MSARPAISQLLGEDLDLLLSRSLDGDLSPEEEAELQGYLATDPAARHRSDELSEILGALKDLPNASTPFALATRVNTQVSERSSGLGAALHRYGVFLSPAALTGIVVALGLIVAVGLFTFNPRAGRPAAAPVEDADAKSDGPVTVFFQPSANGPAGPAARGRAALAWSIEILPLARMAAPWKLATTHFEVPVYEPLEGTYNLTLEPDGRVSSVRPIAPAEMRTDIGLLLRSLVFEPLKPGAPNQIEVRISAR
ncbi:MAG: hypothetical protein ABIT01_08565 [Thermoanaerobaculia bacterium]